MTTMRRWRGVEEEGEMSSWMGEGEEEEGGREKRAE
jgi:hypothetical protein